MILDLIVTCLVPYNAAVERVGQGKLDHEGKVWTGKILAQSVDRFAAH